MNLRRTTHLALALAARSALSAPAFAETDSNDPSLRVASERRSGLVAGIAGGFALGTASGYPNDAKKIGDAAYYGAGGAMPGYAGTSFLMYAPADVFSFGIWFGGVALGTSDWTSQGYGGGFRFEAFPLWSVGAGRLKDLGFSAQFGVGYTNLQATRGAFEGSSGTQSALGVGAFYELRPFWKHLSLAPSVEYNYIAARAIDASYLQIGVRIAAYTGP